MLSPWVRPRATIAAASLCPAMPLPVVAGGAVAGALLMYVVGMATREAKKKGRRR